MIPPIDHGLAAGLAAVSVVQAFADPEKLKTLPRAEFLKAGAATGLGMAVVTLALWWLPGRPLADFALGWSGAPVLSLLLGLGWAMLLIMALRVASRPALERRVRRLYEPHRHLFPESRRELSLAYATAAAAGLGEEIAYRGFLLTYLAAFVGPAGAWLLSSLIFGIAHGYQGKAGMAFATLAGLLLGAVYLATGNLWLVIWMHAAYNVASFTMGYRLFAPASEPRAV